MATGSAPAKEAPARGRRARRSKGDDRERAILETFERLLEKRPLHEISVDDLAQGAGISRPTFYFYFASKEAVLLTLLDGMAEEARANRGEVMERFMEDPPKWLRRGITAIYETFNSHRAVAVAAVEAGVRSPEVRELWERVMEGFVQEVTAAIEYERARGAAPGGVPARDLAIALNLMNERVLIGSFAGYAPTIDEETVVDVLTAAWLGAIYGSSEPAAADAG